MKFLLAPNSFKECAHASVIAELMRKECAKRGLETCVLPLSDGGDGFVRVCASALSLQLTTQKIRRCYDGKAAVTETAWDPHSRTRYIESADIIGLKDVPQKARHPLHLNSENLGRMLHACRSTSHIVIGIGGTATNDLGLGLCRPFGLRLFDADGHELEIVPASYSRVARIALPSQSSFTIDAVLDVRAPLTGEHGSAHVFARQKGATEREVAELEEGTKNILRVLRQQHGIDLRRRKIGAGGGLCVGLSLIAPLRVIRSRDFIHQTFQLKKAIADCDIVITGEGRFDGQSLMDKATGVVIDEACLQRKKVVVVAGRIHVSAKKQTRNSYLSFIELVPMFRTEKESIRHFREGIRRAMKEIFDSNPL